jgi:hypothetical protein
LGLTASVKLTTARAQTAAFFIQVFEEVNDVFMVMREKRY